jgi:hypothetical protein
MRSHASLFTLNNGNAAGRFTVQLRRCDRGHKSVRGGVLAGESMNILPPQRDASSRYLV